MIPTSPISTRGTTYSIKQKATKIRSRYLIDSIFLWQRVYYSTKRYPNLSLRIFRSWDRIQRHPQIFRTREGEHRCFGVLFSRCHGWLWLVWQVCRWPWCRCMTLIRSLRLLEDGSCYGSIGIKIHPPLTWHDQSSLRVRRGSWPYRLDGSWNLRNSDVSGHWTTQTPDTVLLTLSSRDSNLSLSRPSSPSTCCLPNRAKITYCISGLVSSAVLPLMHPSQGRGACFSIQTRSGRGDGYFLSLIPTPYLIWSVGSKPPSWGHICCDWWDGMMQAFHLQFSGLLLLPF